ncbi:MAG: HNH/ENDO VII family nuclease, partial [Candidatus Gracilibacteria bacterium]|nr:HNH/ENDO VII family nuclease [Candidatus Gracilibacteria bacterium]
QTVEETETSLDSSGNTVKTASKEYIYGNGGIDDVVAVVMNDGTQSKTYYYHKDNLGSTVAITDEFGNMVEKYRYDVFGKSYVYATVNSGGQSLSGWIGIDEYEKISGNKLLGNSRLYTGREYDSETGLYFYRARYYDSESGRFISRDPIGVADNVNLYSYVGNNPVMYTDPSGMFSWGDPRISGLVKIGMGALQTVCGGALVVGGIGTSETGVGLFAAAYGVTQVVGGVGTIGDGIAQIITGEKVELGENLADNINFVGKGIGAIVDYGSDKLGGLNCSTKTLIKTGTQIVIDVIISHKIKSRSLEKLAGSVGKKGKNPIFGNIKKLPRDELKLPQERGNAFILKKDGNPVEIHHKGQNPNGPFVEMTKGDHRLGENYKKNHNNPNQNSSIDRSEFNKWKKEYWSKEYDNYK